MRKYKQLTISISGNRKTSNSIDIVRGCVGAAKRHGGCYNSCYATKMARVSNIDFSMPVVNTFNRPKLQAQLAKNKSSWIRIGTTGDPSSSWSTTADVCELVADAGKVPVVMTKAWQRPNNKQLAKMGKAKTHLQVGFSALDTRTELHDRALTVGAYSAYYQEGAVVKLMSTAWSHSRLSERQQGLVEFGREYNFMELPLRIYKTVPYANKIDWSVMRHHISPFTGKEDISWTAGPMFAPKDYSTETHLGTNYVLCPENTCDTCPHRCGTYRQ